MEGFYRGKLVTVTGGTGLNGSYLVKELVERGARVRAITHLRPANEFTGLARETIMADLADEKSTRAALRGSEIVIHAGGITGGVQMSKNDPGALVAQNSIMATQVISACAKENVGRFGFLSSAVVYPPSASPSRENEAWKGEPHKLYFGVAWVTKFAEKLCEFYAKNSSLEIAIVRMTNTYGRYDNFDRNTSHVLPALIQRAMCTSNSFVVWGDGNDVRDFVHASDAAKGILLAIEKRATCDPINIGSGNPCTIRELAATILELIDSKATIMFDKSKPSAVPVRCVDITKSKEELGYSPSISLRAGLEDTIKWYKNPT